MTPTPPTSAQAAADAALALLRDPPWERGTRQGKLPVLAAEPRPTEERIDWKDDAERDACRCVLADWALQRIHVQDGWPTALALRDEAGPRLLAGEPLRADDLRTDSRFDSADPAMLQLVPAAARLALWNSYPPARWRNWGLASYGVTALLAEFGPAAIPGLVAIVQADPDYLQVAARVDSPRLVPIMLRVARQKQRKALAQAWLRRFPRTALAAALPTCFQAAAGATRDEARQGVRWLVAQGHEPLLRDSAAAFGPGMAQAVDALLAEDPLLHLPARLPALPDFAAGDRLPALQTVDGRTAPAGSTAQAARMLAIGTLDAPYAGIEVLRAGCTRASLDATARALFGGWLAAGAPAKEGWAFTALGVLGGDDAARELAPLLLRWPSEGLSARAQAGIDLLAAIGSDLALMHLDILAAKAKTPALRDKARTRIQSIADERGLTPEQLADRLVPRLGLDATGADVLDFGPRRFTLHFDEALRPLVKDEAGKRLKDLPRPNGSDDAAKAEAATRRFKQVKKDAKAIADQQLARFERAMVERRRWSGAEFRSLFLQHPVLRHLVARLAWAVMDGEEVRTAFRVAEDWTLADDHDATLVLADDATVGLPHPVELGVERLQRLQALFDDYEVMQPFRQLTRETYALTDAERAASALTRWSDRVLACASVLGLARKGWQPTGADSGGWVSELARPCGDWRVEFRMEPGTQVGNPTLEPRQRVPQVALRAPGGDAPQAPRFGDLHPVLASELLRDFELLPQAGA